MSDSKTTEFQKGFLRGRFEEAHDKKVYALIKYAKWLKEAYENKAADLPPWMYSDLCETLEEIK